MKTRIMALLMGVLVLSGCEDIMGPMFGSTLLIHGPSYTVASESKDYVVAGATEYQCRHPLTFETGVASTDSYSRFEWIGAEVAYYDVGSRTPYRTEAVGTEDARWHLPSLYAGGESHADWTVKERYAPFDWKLTVHVYDSGSRKTRTASFRATCRLPGM